MKLIVEIDDGTDRDRLMEILDVLASFHPYVRRATLTAETAADGP